MTMNRNTEEKWTAKLRVARLFRNAVLVGTVGLTTMACASTPISLAGSENANHAGQSTLVAEAIALDPFAAKALKAGNWAKAVSMLEGNCEEDPLKMINLAYAYRQQGRRIEALQLYQDILAGARNPYAERPGGVPLRVKTIARTAIQGVKS